MTTEMKATYTPGPWKAEEGSHACFIWGPGEFLLDREIATTRRTDISYEFTANARLIAAAPAMYEALKQASAYFDHDEHYPVVSVIDAALAQAEGRNDALGCPQNCAEG